ncbi:hypothetical protein [Kurthia huakuii]|uniref:hypothetical protein n=1 Tax=Kurthia huakuii TaxID=1421019 RepID=UPI000496A8E3|nr:hypothetical protein [Kurthia huakuii]MBM7698667.1 hypothetical protein [Kurthia huakuii]
MIESIGYDTPAPFVLIAFYDNNGFRFKKVCYTYEEVEAVVTAYQSQIGLYKGTTYIQMANELNNSSDLLADFSRGLEK